MRRRKRVYLVEVVVEGRVTYQGYWKRPPTKDEIRALQTQALVQLREVSDE